jgi:DNA mismatch repair protein MutS2
MALKEDPVISAVWREALGVGLSALGEYRRRDVTQRLRLSDVAGLSAILSVDRNKAFDLVKRYNETLAGAPERAALRTPDARRLAKELLQIMAEAATSELTKSSILTSAPTLNPARIREGLELFQKGAKIRRSLLAAGRSREVAKALGDAYFEQPPSGSSDLIGYFFARIRFLEGALTLIEGFSDAGEVAEFLAPLDRKGLSELRSLMVGAEGGKAPDAEAVIADAEVVANEELRRGRVDADSARRIVEDQVEGVATTLRMTSEEEDQLRKAALEGLRIPFEFDRGALKALLRNWKGRVEEERAKKVARLEASLKARAGPLDVAVERVALLDRALAVAEAAERYGLVSPAVGEEGIAFADGRNPFLVRDAKDAKAKDVLPVSYSLGRTKSLEVAKARNVAVLTGANSGGKTTLLTTLASIHILTLLGLPVPCRQAEVPPVPIYLFRKRVTRRIGSLEHALGSLIPVFGDRRRKLVLIDEFEALTEPGAAGTILGTVLNQAATGSSLVLVVTHLARETLPHVRLPVRVDGIEATGLDEKGELVVDRQPKFSHIGSSTPKLIIMKLARSARKRRVRELYEEILASIREEKASVQAPIVLPWTDGDDD